MFIEREAYLQEYHRREMVQGLEFKRLAKAAQNVQSKRPFRFSRKMGHQIQLLNDRVRALVRASYAG